MTKRRKRRRKRRRFPGCDPLVFDSFYAKPLLGIDEVGTGCIAGPLCAAGVILPTTPEALQALVSTGLKDSKEMTPLSRERTFLLLEEHAVYARAVFLFPRDIERIGQSPSLDLMFTDIIANCRKTHKPMSVVLDGYARKGVGFSHQGVPQGDQKSLTVSAASVWAKVSRDRFMIKLAEKYPGYGFENHKGYDTRSHREALEKLGVADIHRRNTKTIKKLISE